ncbi:hypothetical protein JCM21714_4148 [Gracilibacillus boraciitolerans JCM 21714]|uniref:Uncharacterized protein n=1 Tax=Gracilibacillus boraciitolerans JCM 21714 TaxID=1298598 RepID=W4VP22_9BACI|nr:hypothetical protein [Gracilibacillus boraciitolerans]GAE94947.1 hypothetical protein JCM21714_4148 [Gracilibacillus boraciitolerans JCM 21714]
MRNVSRILFVISMAIFSFFFYITDISANEHEVTVKPTIKEDIIQVQSANYIKEGNATIRRVHSQTVGSSCNTSSYSSVQQISCTIYLQVQNKTTGQWTNTGKSKRFVNYYSSYVSGSVNFYIQTGYDYRIRSIHTTTQSGTIDQLIAVTGGN